MIRDAELSALLTEYERTPTPDLRVQLLEEHLAASQGSLSVLMLARGRDLLASEQRRVDRILTSMIRIEAALTASPSQSRLVAARARLAAVG